MPTITGRRAVTVLCALIPKATHRSLLVLRGLVLLGMLRSAWVVLPCAAGRLSVEQESVMELKGAAYRDKADGRVPATETLGSWLKRKTPSPRPLVVETLRWMTRAEVAVLLAYLTQFVEDDS